MSGKKAILLGYSGHGYVVAEAALLSGITLSGYAEKTQIDINPYEIDYMGFEQNNDFAGWLGGYEFILGIGDNLIRSKVANTVTLHNAKLINVIHPNAQISNYATIGSGNFIARAALINPLVKIARNCIINTGCIIEHECTVNSNVHIAPGAVLTGNVIVGENSFIGANAVIKQGVTIGNNVTIGAGSVVLKNIANNEVWAGNPAKRIK